MKTEIERWIKAKADILDHIIAKAAEQSISKFESYSNFAYDLKEVQRESFNLMNGKDLCYDRPTIPLSYSLWYQGRRINGFLNFFIEGFLENNEDQVDIFDLGAGTGAAQMALGVVYCAFLEIYPGKLPNRVRIINVDSSPFMLSYNETYLWPAFLDQFPMANQIDIEYTVNSWDNKNLVEANNVWLTASYLFDISDQMEEVSNGFVDLVKEYRPAKLLLTASNQTKKREILDQVAGRLEEFRYSSTNIPQSLLLSGKMELVTTVRKKLWHTCQGWGLNNDVHWDEKSIYGKILTGSRGGQQLSMVAIYASQQKSRTKLTLSDEQKTAAAFRGRPSKIIGSAGSGKTVVITEKVKQLVEASNYDPKMRILITTFNKQLTLMIKGWLCNLLDEQKIDVFNIDGEYQFKFGKSYHPSIYVMHFDILPTRFGGIKSSVKTETEHILSLESIAKNYVERHNLGSLENLPFLSPEFLWEEYIRVFYGNNIKEKGQYLEEHFFDEDSETKVKVRSGRGNTPRVTIGNRSHIYACIREYMMGLDKFGYSFCDRRRFFLNSLKNAGVGFKFDYLFVDEFQDCTRSDFKIFYSLLKDPNNITITGDLAQSIHIGKSATSNARPVKKINGITLRNFESFPLGVSYRLPFRIAQSLEPLSKEIILRWQENPEEANNLMKIHPVKNAPPGARPIVVYGEEADEISKKVAEIIKAYRNFRIDKFTLLENDVKLAKSLWNKGLKGRRDTILSLKGIENPLIIWSSRQPISDKKEVYEFLYTIFTRTTSILIIALFPETLEEYIPPLKLFNKELLVFWDADSARKFDEIVSLNIPVE